MQTNDLLKKVRRIEIKSRALSQNVFAGQYHSAFKGQGMAFTEVREYQPGDDVRHLHWKVTARFGRPYLKVFEEERELTTLLLVDASASQTFGTASPTKRDLVAEVAAVLAFSSIQNQDKVGLMFVTDRVERFIPPGKGKQHVLRLIRELLEFRPQHPGTDLGEGFKYLTNALKKKATVFVISDFQTSGFETALRVAANKHDLVALRVVDPHEAELPNVGLLPLVDAETGRRHWLDTSLKAVRHGYTHRWNAHAQYLQQTLHRAGVDLAYLRTDRPYVPPLVQLFKRRGA